MKYTIRELEREFTDFDSSELVAALVAEGYEDEATEEERVVEVDEHTEDDFWDSNGYSWAKQIAEAKSRGTKVYSVASQHHEWYRGLVKTRK